jgi:hypothetical protein
VAPISCGALAIIQCIHVRLHDLPFASIGRTARDYRRPSPFVDACFAQAFDGDVDPNSAAIAKKIGNRFADRKDWHRCALDVVLLYAGTK